MKNLNTTGYNKTLLDWALLALRIFVGVGMLTHGFPKLQYLLSGDTITFPDPFFISPTLSLALAVFAEFFCAILVIIGLRTRFATLPIIITMIVAILAVHITDGLEKQELPLLYLSIFTCILIIGGGSYSVDQMLFNRNKSRSQVANQY